MNIKINLTKGQIKGIKNYLREAAGIENPTMQDVREELEGRVQLAIFNPAESLNDYMQQYEQDKN